MYVTTTYHFAEYPPLTQKLTIRDTSLTQLFQQEREFQLEKCRQAFFSGIVEKLVTVIKDRDLAEVLSTVPGAPKNNFAVDKEQVEPSFQ